MRYRPTRTSYNTPLAVVLILTAACSPSERSVGAAAATSPAEPQGADRAGRPCALLTLADVQRVLPAAAAAAVDRDLEKYGLFRCEWVSPSGRAILVDGAEAEDSAMDEATTWAMSVVDPLKSAAVARVRYERLKHVGDEAIAVVETADVAKGFLQPNAFVVVRRGRRQVTLMVPSLARGDRGAALAALSEIGATLAARLE
jgi:hypothetical protein